MVSQHLSIDVYPRSHLGIVVDSSEGFIVVYFIRPGFTGPDACEPNLLFATSNLNDTCMITGNNDGGEATVKLNVQCGCSLTLEPGEHTLTWDADPGVNCRLNVGSRDGTFRDVLPITHRSRGIPATTVARGLEFSSELEDLIWPVFTRALRRQHENEASVPEGPPPPYRR